MTLTPYPALDAAIAVVGAILLAAFVINVVWTVIAIRDRRRSRRRRARDEHTRPARKSVLSKDEYAQFWEFVFEHPELSARMTQLWAGIEPDEEYQPRLTEQAIEIPREGEGQ